MKTITLITTKQEEQTLSQTEINSILAYFQERVAYFTALKQKIAQQATETATIDSSSVL